jgi:phage terminase large subunit-like protein
MARINSLQVVISTAQYDRTHLGYEQYRLACDIRDGKLTDLHTLPVIYSLLEEADWTKEENWWPVCPSIDVTVSKDYYRDEFQKVKNSPQDETRFRTFLLCQWVGHSEQWINTQIWDKCKEPFKEEDLYGLPAIVGLDCARKWDLAAYVLLIRKDDHVYLLPRVFTPAQLAKHKETTDKVPYRRWAKNGYVTLTDGDVIDYEEIRNSLKRDAENFSIDAVYYDPYGFEESRRLLEEEGFNMIEATQSPAIMAPATNHFERLVLDGKIRHNGNECLSWCLGNCTVKVDQHERIQIEKRKSTGRIDAAVAAVIGCVGLLAEKEEADWEGPTFFS